VPYLVSWAESAPAGTFERIAGLVNRLARRLEHTLGADAADSGGDADSETATKRERASDIHAAC
jgi:hypothetical protein